MKLLVLSLAVSAALVGCGKKDGAGGGGDKPAAADKELDLSPLGDDFKGYIAMAPGSAKVNAADKQITLSDTDFISISEAEYWDDGVKELGNDKDNKNIKKESGAVTYERTPPAGTAWAVDVKVKAGEKTYSCGTGMIGTFTSAAMRDSIGSICKSIKKQ